MYISILKSMSSVDQGRQKNLTCRYIGYIIPFLQIKHKPYALKKIQLKEKSRRIIMQFKARNGKRYSNNPKCHWTE